MLNKLNLNKNQIINLQVTFKQNENNDLKIVNDDNIILNIRSLPIKNKANLEIINFFKKQGYEIKIIKGLKSKQKIIKIINVL